MSNPIDALMGGAATQEKKEQKNKKAFSIEWNGKKVNVRKRITVYGTSESKTMVEGKEYKVSEPVAEALIRSGDATKTKPKKEDK